MSRPPLPHRCSRRIGWRRLLSYFLSLTLSSRTNDTHTRRERERGRKGGERKVRNEWKTQIWISNKQYRCIYIYIHIYSGHAPLPQYDAQLNKIVSSLPPFPPFLPLSPSSRVDFRGEAKKKKVSPPLSLSLYMCVCVYLHYSGGCPEEVKLRHQSPLPSAPSVLDMDTGFPTHR